MKLTFKQEVSITRGQINITFNLPLDSDPIVQISWSCGDCGGRGCNHHRMFNAECNNGTIIKELNSKFLNENFDPDSRIKFVAGLERLLESFK